MVIFFSPFHRLIPLTADIASVITPCTAAGTWKPTSPLQQVEARRNAPVSIFARGDAKLGDVQRLKMTRWKKGNFAQKTVNVLNMMA